MPFCLHDSERIGSKNNPTFLASIWLMRWVLALQPVRTLAWAEWIEEMRRTSSCRWAFLGRPALSFREEKDSELRDWRGGGDVEVECSLGSCDHLLFCPPPQPPPHFMCSLKPRERREREAAEFLLIRVETAAVKVSGHCSWLITLGGHARGSGCLGPTGKH